jgi:hypothetical protein
MFKKVSFFIDNNKINKYNVLDDQNNELFSSNIKNEALAKFRFYSQSITMPEAIEEFNGFYLGQKVSIDIKNNTIFDGGEYEIIRINFMYDISIDYINEKRAFMYCRSETDMYLYSLSVVSYFEDNWILTREVLCAAN